MSSHGFTSVFADRLDAYIEFKRSTGCYGASRIWYLQKFDAHCTAHDLKVFDQHTVEDWVASRLSTSGRYRSWMSYIRDFGRWLRARGDADAYVLSDRWKALRVLPRPYLLTTREIEAFFAAAARLEAACPWRWQATAFFTLMHSCGLRTGEVRGLPTSRVNLRGRHIDIVWSKASRSRRLPITDDIADILAACDKETSRRFGPGRGTFFISAAGTPVAPASVGVMFNRIWDTAGLPRSPGDKRPRRDCCTFR